MYNLSVIILTYNEEKNVEATLQSLQPLTKEIFIVDSGSEDQTLKIARIYTNKIFHHSFETHTKQWNWALENLPLIGDWILALDADQMISPELQEELSCLFTKDQKYIGGINGIYLKRKQIFRGQWIRHGGYYPKYLLKLFRRSKVITDPHDLMDHHFYVVGKTLKLEGNLIEENQKENDLEFWIEKHRRYARLQAQEELIRKKNQSFHGMQANVLGDPNQRMLWRKKVWLELPLFLRTLAYFIYRYIFQLGFLDGKQGLLFHFYQAFWYRWQVDMHLAKSRKNDS